MMGPDIDCPFCGVEKVRPGVGWCTGCETADRYEKKLDVVETERDALEAKVAELTLKVDELRTGGFSAVQKAVRFKRRLEEAREVLRAFVAAGAVESGFDLHGMIRAQQAARTVLARIDAMSAPRNDADVA